MVTNKVRITVMCLSIGAPKNNKFFICSKWNIYYFRCPEIWAHYSLIIICLNIGTPNNHHFPFGTNGKVVVLGVPILKHFRVLTRQYKVSHNALQMDLEHLVTAHVLLSQSGYLL